MKRDEIFQNIDKNLLKKFKDYDAENQNVYRLFERYSQKMIATGRLKYSAWTIVNLIRWEHDIKNKEPFKINNDFIALYGRLFIYRNFEHLGFFEFRTMKANDRRESNEERYRKEAK